MPLQPIMSVHQRHPVTQLPVDGCHWRAPSPQKLTVSDITLLPCCLCVLPHRLVCGITHTFWNGRLPTPSLCWKHMTDSLLAVKLSSLPALLAPMLAHPAICIHNPSSISSPTHIQLPTSKAYTALLTLPVASCSVAALAALQPSAFRWTL